MRSYFVRPLRRPRYHIWFSSKHYKLFWRSTKKHFVCRSPQRNPSVDPWNMVFPAVFHLTSRHVSFLNSWTEKSKNSKNMNFRTWTKFFCCKMNLDKCICPGWTTWTSTFEFVLYQLDNLVPVLVDIRGFWRFRLESSEGWSQGVTSEILLWIDEAKAMKTYIWVSV